MWAIVAWGAPCVLAYFFLSWIRRWIRIDNVDKRYVLITGCDHGYGNLLAQRLDMLGCHVFAACAAESSKNRLQQMTSSKLRAFTMDVKSSDSVRQGVEYIKVYITETEGLWGLVNCAETMGDVIGPLEWHTVDDVINVMATNTLGVVRVTQAFLPLLKKARGRIVNLCQVEGRVIQPWNIPYGMSKAAIEAFSDGLRPHVHQYGVSVHIIEPGLFQADIAQRQKGRKAVQQGWKSTPWHLKEEFGEAYAENLTNHVTSLIDNASPKVNKVIKSFVHALTARCPRGRYAVGLDANFCWLPLSYMPSSVTDFFLCKWTKDLVPACLRPEVTPDDVNGAPTVKDLNEKSNQ